MLALLTMSDLLVPQPDLKKKKKNVLKDWTETKVKSNNLTLRNSCFSESTKKKNLQAYAQRHVPDHIMLMDHEDRGPRQS